MRIAIASDHAALDMRKQLVKFLTDLGHEIDDCGPDSPESVDYPDFAAEVAKRVSSGQVARGVLCCGSGMGMAISANKISGVRAVVVHSEWEAEMCRRHNDANIACFGARQQTFWMAERYLKVFLATSFEGGRHTRRVEKICGLDGSEMPGEWASGGDA